MGEEVTFKTEELIAGDITTDVVTLTEGKYYRGMPVVFDDTSGKWSEAEIEEGAPLAIYLGNGIDNPRTITADSFDTIIKAGGLYEGGIVDDDGAPVAFTEQKIEILRANGIFVKRK